MRSEPVLGIDFGTTNSVCAVLSGGDPEILENSEGNRVTPSVVYYTQKTEQNRPLVGRPAENKAEDNPERVIRSIKRKMGESDFITVPNDETGEEDEYRVEDVAADIIRKVRTDASEKLGVDRDELTRAVITTPAYWESDRKQAVIQAAKLAGFESARTIKEPASAAIAYGRFEPGLDKTVGVYDLGGGTFDFAIVDVDVGSGKSGSEYNVIAQSGDPQLGGDDWDQRVVDWLVSNFEKETSVNPLEPHHADSQPYEHEIREERIRTKAREAKEALSNTATTDVDIRLPFLMTIGEESVDIDTKLTQVQFESMTEDLIEQTVDPVHTALNDAGLSVHDIDDVVLVGGSTRMPQVSELVKSVFQQQPKQRVNPDEAVAAGAAIKGNRNDILLLEVTPLSLGIGIKGDRFKRMIGRNERLPARTTEVFTTSNEGATAVRIPVYQGERDIASENRHLKTLIIEGMAPGSRHSAHIEVTFEVQQNGLINVQAVESTRNKSVNVELEGENQLPDEYIQKRVEEAKKLEEMDRRRQKVIEAQNDARKALKDADRLLSEFPHVFEEDESDHMRRHITNVRNIRNDSAATLGELRKATEDLNEWILEIGDRIRRTGARNKSGPKKGPDTEPADVKESSPDGVRTAGPGETVTNTGQDVSDTDDAEDWNDDAPSAAAGVTDVTSTPGSEDNKEEFTTDVGGNEIGGVGEEPEPDSNTGSNSELPSDFETSTDQVTNSTETSNGTETDQDGTEGPVVPDDSASEMQTASGGQTDTSADTDPDEALPISDDEENSVGDVLTLGWGENPSEDSEEPEVDTPITPDSDSETAGRNDSVNDGQRTDVVTDVDETIDAGDSPDTTSEPDIIEDEDPPEVSLSDDLNKTTGVSDLGSSTDADDTDTPLPSEGSQLDDGGSERDELPSPSEETTGTRDNSDAETEIPVSDSDREDDNWDDDRPVFGEGNGEKLEPDKKPENDDDDDDDDDGTEQGDLSDNIGFS